MDQALRILIADDDPLMREMLSTHLGDAGHSVVVTSDGTEALDRLDGSIDVALFDLRMPGATGIECLIASKRRFPELPVILVSAAGDVQDAVAAMRRGAFDYVVKPYDAVELVARVAEAGRVSRLGHENRQLRAAITASGPTVKMVAESEAGRRVVELADRAALSTASVLVTGPSGTGKTLLARRIHQRSDRASGPFVTVSCAALPRDLVESELFGHERGAFTGAVGARMGRIEAADGGTLFLDEIGELPIELQPKLLNVLQDRMVRRVGGEREKSVDVRIIAATNRDLSTAVADGQFREDLFFRLDVVRIEMPALLARRDDIPLIASETLQRVADRRGERPHELTADAMHALRAHPWPGNIRELENALERASALCTGERIDVKDLGLRNAATSSHDAAGASSNGTIDTTAGDADTSSMLVGRALRDIERDAIAGTLASVGWNRTAAARILGISERTVYNKIRQHDLQPPN